MIYQNDHRAVRKAKGKDISIYVDAQFKRAREAKTYNEAWDTYVVIQKEIPEELILIEGTDVIPSAKHEESARLMSWKEMRALLLEAKQNESSKAASQFLDSPLGAEPSEEPFQKAWNEATEDLDFSPHDGFQFAWLLAPYLPTQTGGLWAEKMGDAYVEEGNYLRAYAQYKAIKDHSIAHNERIEKKLNYVINGLGKRLHRIKKASALKGLKLSDGTVYRLVVEELGMHKEKTLFLEIAYQKGKVIQKRIDDAELTHLNSKKYGHFLIRDGDKILLMPPPWNRYLIFDLNGMLLEKVFTKEEIASRYGIKNINELLFSRHGFRLISRGIFNMGSPPDEEGRGGDETLHSVTITKDFYLQKTEVTQLQWYLVM
ncbi:MAG: hypothetical protein AAB309_04710, partial [Deltaproteobacteria bacterium]